MTTQKYYEQKRKKLQQRMEKLDQQEQRALLREQRHDEKIAKELAGVPCLLYTSIL